METMKTKMFLAVGIGLVLSTQGSLSAAEAIKLHAKPGSKMRIEGTSSLHDWQVESKIIGGSLEAGDNFPLEPGQDVKPGKVEGRAEAFVTVKSLRSVEKNGSFYSDKMDEIMYDKLKAAQSPRIVYRTKELTLKEVPKSKDAPYVLEAKGELVVAGVTNEVSMPVNVLPLGEKKLRITGSLPSKMSNFKIPPESIGLGIVKTGDDIKLIWDWMVGPAKPTAAASK